MGEDGTVQKMLENKKVKYNGSDSLVSKLCMDKWMTNEIIRNAKIKGVSVAKHILLSANRYSKLLSNNKESEIYWNKLLEKLETKTIIAKPRGDGCTAGVALFLIRKICRPIFL